MKILKIFFTYTFNVRVQHTYLTSIFDRWWWQKDEQYATTMARQFGDISVKFLSLGNLLLSPEIKSWIKRITTFRPIRRTIPGLTYRLYVVLNLQVLNGSSLKVAFVPIHNEYVKRNGIGISTRVSIGVESVLWDDFWSRRYIPRLNKISQM